ncbi:MAG: 50S ribosomal protein L22 [Nanoarchaeota archaeon]
MEKENTAKAMGISLPISTKQAVEICNFLRGKTTEQSKNILKDVINKKAAIPFKRYNRDMGHKTGMAAGRYPKNASSQILKLLESVEANAQNKGLAPPFKITKLLANKAAKQWHYGRHLRTKMKKTHVEIVVEETEKKENKTKKQNKKIKIVNNAQETKK